MSRLLNKSFFKSPILFNALIVLASVFILLPEHIFMHARNGLDPSWVIAINMAVKQQLIFGQEFIFPFGPLGFLYTGLPLYVSQYSIIAFHLFLLTSIAFIIYYFVKQIESKLAKAGFFVFLLFIYTDLFAEKAFLLLIIFLFYIFYHIREKKPFALYTAGMIALLAFFVKLNTGLLLSFLLVPYLFLLNFLKYKKLTFTGLFILVYLLLLFSFSYLMHLDVFSYIQNGLDIINNYNDAVNKPPLPYMFLIAVAVILVYFFVLVMDLKLIVHDKIRLLIVLYVSLASFVLFKEGFVRADSHVMLFFGNSAALFSLLIFFEKDKDIRLHRFYGIILIGLLSIVSEQAYFGLNNPMLKAYRQISKLPCRDFLLNEYKQQASAIYEREQNNAKIPERVLEKIKDKTVDIIPTDISYVYFNNLTYNPRPGVQSYESFSSRLDMINAAKYASASAPDYLLFAMGSIDGRHPFWDESKTKQVMLTHYQFDDTLYINSNNTESTHEDFVLLKKRDSNQELILVSSKIQTYHLGDTLAIPQSDNLLYLEADFEYTFPGKIMRLLFQPNRLKVEIWYDEIGNSSGHLAIKPILTGGVLINKKAISLDDAIGFFDFPNSKTTDVRAVCFAPKYGYKLGFNDNAILTLREYKLKGANVQK